MEKGPWDNSLAPLTRKSEKSEISPVVLRGNIANGKNDP